MKDGTGDAKGLALQRLYPIVKTFQQVAKLLRISPERTLRRAGLSPDIMQIDDKGLSPAQVFALWQSIMIESDRTDLPLYLARLFAHAPFTPAMFAFSCSPDVRTGLRRLAVFKPLMGPIALELDETRDGLDIGIVSVDPNLPAPPPLLWFEVLFFLECARSYTAEHIVPTRIELPPMGEVADEVLDFMGCRPAPARRASLTLSREDAALPLITENPEAWPDFERQLRRKLDVLQSDTPVTARASRILHEMLPAGEATIEQLSTRMAVSRRTLQRQLHDEETSFQELLNAVRSDLAMRYLSEGFLSVEEIAYLLAYREPNSFYRAFQTWTGMTPSQARGMRSH